MVWCSARSFIKNGPNPASFCLFSAYFLGLYGIRTRIVGVEGENADH